MGEDHERRALPRTTLSRDLLVRLHDGRMARLLDLSEAGAQIEHLRATPAAVRFLSLEPLLEDLGTIDLSGIGWVIVGGESGPGARPCDVEWAEDLVLQCREAGVPCFVKQLGARPYSDEDHPYWAVLPLMDPKGGDPSEWPEDLRVRQYPEVNRG